MVLWRIESCLSKLYTQLLLFSPSLQLAGLKGEGSMMNINRQTGGEIYLTFQMTVKNTYYSRLDCCHPNFGSSLKVLIHTVFFRENILIVTSFFRISTRFMIIIVNILLKYF